MRADLSSVKVLVTQYLSASVSLYRNGPIELGVLESGELLSSYVASISVVDLLPHQSVSFWQVRLCLCLCLRL